MTEIPDFEPRWPMPATGAELSEIAQSLWISKVRLAEVIGVSRSAIYRDTLSQRTKDRLAPLLEVYNCAIWMADDEKKAAFWMNHGHPTGMGKGSPLDWIAKGEAETVKNAQGALLAGVYA